jgi:hypothetical protein
MALEACLTATDRCCGVMLSTAMCNSVQCRAEKAAKSSECTWNSADSSASNVMVMPAWASLQIHTTTDGITHPYVHSCGVDRCRKDDFRGLGLAAAEQRVRWFAYA